MTVLPGQDAKIAGESAAKSPNWLDRAHEWVVTVDHKKLGIMYILTGLVL